MISYNIPCSNLRYYSLCNPQVEIPGEHDEITWERVFSPADEEISHHTELPEPEGAILPVPQRG